LKSLGFVAPAGSGASFNGGIGPVNPALEGVPSIGFSKLGTELGVPNITTGQFNTTYQIQDNFTKVIGTHTWKFGAGFHYDQINERNFFGENGVFAFDGTETGSDFVDFLIATKALSKPASSSWILVASTLALSFKIVGALSPASPSTMASAGNSVSPGMTHKIRLTPSCRASNPWSLQMLPKGCCSQGIKEFPRRLRQPNTLRSHRVSAWPTRPACRTGCFQN
jgi:hypothetical protein